MYPLIDLEQTQMKQNLPEFRAGDTVRVQVRLIEGNRERVQAFEGIVIAFSGLGDDGRLRCAKCPTGWESNAFSPCTLPSWIRSRSYGMGR